CVSRVLVTSHDVASSALSPLSLHDALPILPGLSGPAVPAPLRGGGPDLPPADQPYLRDHQPPRHLRRHARRAGAAGQSDRFVRPDRKSTRLNSSHVSISYAVFCLKKKYNS